MKASLSLKAALLLMISAIIAPSGAQAQKSLSDGVDELAAKLAKSFGEAKKGRVAILPLRELAAGENLLGAYIAETLTSSFFEVGYRDIVERQMLDRAIQELKLTLTGIIDSESAKKIGKFLHADFVVGGSMTELTGEVSVNCRMFAVETGEVVAVATTKIVKDDSVKAMLAKSILPTSGGVAPRSRSDDEAEHPTEAVQEAKGLSFRLRSCSHRGGTVDCELSITALDNDAEIQVWRQSRLVDTHGNESETSVISFSSPNTASGRIGEFSGGDNSSSNLELVRGVARTGHVRFEDVEVEGSSVPLIEIQFGPIARPSFSSHREQNGRVQFRNVRVK